jgi:hypothetical protein
MTRDQIRELFGRNKSSAEIEAALRLLLALGLERTYLLRLIKQFKVKCSPGRIGGSHNKRK